MEQTGTGWGPLLAWLLVTKPKRVVHIEPVLDFYDPGDPVDQTAIEAHIARGFWTGYLETLIELADEGCIEIEDMERSWFGSLLTEGYSQIVWKPL